MSENTIIFKLFQNLLGNNFSEFVRHMPYDGFVSAGVHYCVLRDKG